MDGDKVSAEPTPQELVTEVRAALEAATPGPWSDYRQDCLPRKQRTTTIKAVTVQQDNWRATQTVAKTDQTSKRKYDDAYLIANAPTWLGQLCTALTAALDANREMHEAIADLVSLAESISRSPAFLNGEAASMFKRWATEAVGKPSFIAVRALAAPPPTGVSLRAELAEAKAEVERLKAATPNHLQGDGPCQDCGSLNIVWFTDNVVWNAVMEAEKHVFASDRPETGILCPFCFVKRAEEAGLRPTGWRITPEWPWRTAALAGAATPETGCVCGDPACEHVHIFDYANFDDRLKSCQQCGLVEPTPETEQAP